MSCAISTSVVTKVPGRQVMSLFGRATMTRAERVSALRIGLMNTTLPSAREASSPPTMVTLAPSRTFDSSVVGIASSIHTEDRSATV